MENILDTLQKAAAEHPPALPLKLLVVTDSLGDAGDNAPVKIGPDGIEGLFGVFRPARSFEVDNKSGETAQKIPIDLQIRGMQDFRPESLVSRIDALSAAAQKGESRLSEQLDEILHHRDFQRMESTWRGLHRLCRDSEGLKGIRVEVLSASRKNLRDRFHARVFDPEYAGSVDIPLSAVFFNFSFSHEPSDLPLLEALAEDCATLQAVMITACSPAFFQLRNIIHLPSLPNFGAKLQLPAYAGWRQFQTNEKSRWVCMTANRYLARETYELKKTEGAPFDYTEKADPGHPERYLWAEAGWLISSNLVRSFARFRHCVVIDGMSPETAHPNLPVRPFPKKANVNVPSPTEILIDDDKAWEIVRGGVTMLVGISDGAVATFPLIANVYRLRPGTVTTESALSYQLFAGHLSHFLMTLYPDIPVDEGMEAARQFMRQKLHEFLIPFAGDSPEECVGVEIACSEEDPAQRSLGITLKPLLKMQGKDVDFTFQLSL